MVSLTINISQMLAYIPYIRILWIINHQKSWLAYDAHLAGIHQLLIINPHARARTAIDFSLQRTTSHALGTC